MNSIEMRLLAPAVSLLMTAGSLSAQCHEGDIDALDIASGDTAGNSVAIWRDTLVYGAKNKDDVGPKSGAAYAFERVAGSWVESAKLSPSDLAADDFFGDGVALFEDLIVVGSPRADAPGLDSGAAYVFERIGGLWVERAKLVAGDGAAGDEFGHMVAVHNGVIGVSSQNSGPGAVYLYELSGGLWVQVQKLVPSDGAANDAFGHSIDIWGERVLVGAQHDDDLGNRSGSAYVFERSGSTWIETDKLLPSDGEAEDRFGREVSLHGERLLVAAENDDMEVGSSYVFDLIGGSWQESAKLMAADGEVGDQLGRDIAVWGDLAILGSFGDDDGGADAGATYVFQKTTAGWVQAQKIVPVDSVAGDRFGRATDLYETVLAIGAPLVDSIAGNAGRTRVYSLGRSTPYCMVAPNSTGVPAELTMEGTASLSLNSLALVTTSLPDEPGIIFFGPDQVQLPFGNGFRCVGGALSRLPVVFAAGGELRYEVDLGTSPANQITASSTWNFQTWFRDPAAGGAAFNLSRGLEIEFCP